MLVGRRALQYGSFGIRTVSGNVKAHHKDLEGVIVFKYIDIVNV